MKLRFLQGLLLIGLLVFSSSCTVYKANYSKEEVNWNRQVETDSIDHTVYLIGDAGRLRDGATSPALLKLKERLDNANKKSALVILGDNIYPSGMPPKKQVEARENAELNLDVQLDILKNYKGKPFIIPGNHDWRNGLKGIKRQEKYVEDKLNRGNTFAPDNGCGGPEIVKLSEGAVMIILDSDWWLINWDKQPKINRDCPNKTRNDFMDAFKSALNKYKEKKVLVVMHHPLYTYGEHGGKFPAKQHLFPFTLLNKNLYLPVPVFGTFISMLRGDGGFKEDLKFTLMNDFKKQILTATGNYDNVVFAAGHEHNLQHIEVNGQTHIVTGSGTNTTPVKVGGPAKFTYGGLGYTVLKFHKKGNVIVDYWGTPSMDVPEKLLFSKEIFPAQKEQMVFDFSEYNEHRDSVSRTLYNKEETTKKASYRYWWGDMYREVYAKKIKVPVLDLSVTYGGLTPIKTGGGQQTNSLRLETTAGRQYVLRSMEKDGSRLLNGMLKGTFVIDVLHDFFTAAHPYAAFVIPDMAKVANIYHTKPQLVYLPKQPALGKHNGSFGGGMYLFESRPTDDRSDADHFGNSEDIISTPDVLEKIRKNDKHYIDQEFVLRSRLFDMIIGDWDRHGDQWRWATFKDAEGRKFYRPIPRDRDQAFSKFDGKLFGLLKPVSPDIRKYQTFDEKIKKVKWFNFNARYFDRKFLTSLTWADWEKEIDAIQKNLSDEAIEKAIMQLPKEAFELGGEEIIARLKSRRDNVKESAEAYYAILAEKVNVIGTNKEDLFKVEREKNGDIVVKVFSLTKGKKKQKLYERKFERKDTKEVVLYGLNEQDEFRISGNSDKGITVRIVGGEHKDTVEDKSFVKGASKQTKVYDAIDGVILDLGKEGKDKTSKQYFINQYDAEEFKYGNTTFWPLFALDPDNGFALGAGLNLKKNGFKKLPYAQSHTISGLYSFGTNGSNIIYKGEYTAAIGSWDLLNEINLKGDKHTFNFFGFGNESVNDSEDEKRFNQIRQSLVGVNVSLRKKYRSGAAIKFTPLFEKIEIEETPNRYISLNSDVLPSYIL